MSAPAILGAPGQPPSRQRGISLIEVLVGLAIGIIGVLAIFQTVSIWTRHTQTTTAGGDAQVAGTLALFDIERDFKQSGHGFGQAPAPVMGCPVQATDASGRGAFTFNFRPIDIVVGAGGTPDQINVLYGSSSFFVEGEDVLLSPSTTTKTLRRRGGFKAGDLVVVADAGGALPGTANCNLLEITSVANPDRLTVDHTPSASYTSFYGVVGASRFDDAGGIALPSGTMYNLGPNPQAVSWQIVSNRGLQRGETIFNPTPNVVGDGVINLKAEYGVDSNNDTIVQPGEWVDTLPATGNWNQVLAVRVAILVRSHQFERSGDTTAGAPAPVTTAAPTYFDGSATHTFAMGNVNGGADTFSGSPTTADPNNWRYYRYRVYERVIPLKNMLWSLP